MTIKKVTSTRPAEKAIPPHNNNCMTAVAAFQWK
jgi:hypothetical protein